MNQGGKMILLHEKITIEDRLIEYSFFKALTRKKVYISQLTA